jgi:glutathione S-transferase
MNLRLFYAPGSCAFAALAALEYAGATYEPTKLDLAAGDQRSSQYLAINPLGRVPTLLVDGAPVTELIAVLSYIAHRYPASQLLPLDNALSLARAYEMLSWFSTGFHGFIAQIFRGGRFSDDAIVQEHLKESGRRQYVDQLTRLDGAYAGMETGLVGNRFTVVDAFSIVIWRWAERLGIDTSSLIHLTAAIRSSLDLPAVKHAQEIETATPRWLS